MSDRRPPVEDGRNLNTMLSPSTLDDQPSAERPQADGSLLLTGPLRGPVWAVTTAVSPAGQVVIAAGDSKGTVTWWDAVSGELLCDARTRDKSVVRSIITVVLPGPRIGFVTATSLGAQLWEWDEDGPVRPGRTFLSKSGVWSVAALRVSESRTLLFTGEDDGQIHRWDLTTGEPVGEPFGDFEGAVRAMIAVAQIDGEPTLLAGGDDGTVRRFHAETSRQTAPTLPSVGGAVWALTVAEPVAGATNVVSAGNNGVLTRWDESGALAGPPIVVGPGSLSSVVTVDLRDRGPALICGGTDGRLSCWDARTGEPVGRPEPASGRGVFSLAAVPLADDHLKLAAGTDGGVIVAPMAWTSQPRLSAPAQVDSTRGPDRL
ncbi:MAG TPA: hypothetical protein VIL37_13825, partial [Natronosporangium sp.]